MTPNHLCKLLADETRLRILMLLLDKRELCVCELTHALEQPQPKISRHLGVLRNGGLLQDRRDGQWVYYKLNPSTPAWAREILSSLNRGTRQAEPHHSDRVRLAACDPRTVGHCA